MWLQDCLDHREVTDRHKKGYNKPTGSKAESLWALGQKGKKGGTVAYSPDLGTLQRLLPGPGGRSSHIPNRGKYPETEQGDSFRAQKKDQTKIGTHSLGKDPAAPYSPPKNKPPTRATLDTGREGEGKFGWVEEKHVGLNRQRGGHVLLRGGRQQELEGPPRGCASTYLIKLAHVPKKLRGADPRGGGGLDSKGCKKKGPRA